MALDVTRFTTWTCVAQMGYHPRFPPSGAKKPYNALIRGRDTKATFDRDFVAKEFCVDRSVVPALLESRDVTKKGAADDTYILLLPGDGSDECIRQVLPKEDAIWLASQMDAGRSLLECWDVISGRRAVPPKVTLTPEQELRRALTTTLDYLDALRAGLGVPPIDPPSEFDRKEIDALLERTR